MNKGKNKSFLVAVVALVLLAVSVGYALISRNYNFSGTANLGGNTWNIVPPKPEDITEEPPSDVPVVVEEDPTTHDITIKYTANLDNPGDVYTITVPITNDGSVDALLSAVTTNITGDAAEYIDYKVENADTGVKFTTASIESNPVEFNNGETLNVKITVTYKDENNLPESNVSAELKTTLKFTQSK